MELYDLLIIVDDTASMSITVDSLKTVIPQIIHLSALTGAFSRVALLSYREFDYSYSKSDKTKGTHPMEWVGWINLHPDAGDAEVDFADLAQFVEPMEGDTERAIPGEAAKTAFAFAYKQMRAEAKTIILSYTDAEPHSNTKDWNLFRRLFYRAPQREKKYLKKVEDGGNFQDWASAANMLRFGEKKAQVISILSPTSTRSSLGYYAFMSLVTGGICVILKDNDPREIGLVTINILLEWMGAEEDLLVGIGADMRDRLTEFSATLVRFECTHGVGQVATEYDGEAGKFFAGNRSHRKAEASLTLLGPTLTPEIIKQSLQTRDPIVQDFSERWKCDESYRRFAKEYILKIFHSDIRALTLHPAFCPLFHLFVHEEDPKSADWMEECWDALARIESPQDKENMKIWLDRQWDQTRAVLDIINSVPLIRHYPCAFLDSTNEDCVEAIAGLTREYFSKFYRTGESGVFERVGRALSHVKIATCAEEVPKNRPVTKIPLSLANNSQYNNCLDFWRVVLHLIVPGVLVCHKSAIIVAALTLLYGPNPLKVDAANAVDEIDDYWSGDKIIEVLNLPFLTLLVDAEIAYQSKENGMLLISEEDQPINNLLHPKDREAFEILVNFKFLEFNLDATLTGRVPWTPDKFIGPIGPLVKCKICEQSRSVTIMGPDKQCGLCLMPTPENFSAANEIILSSKISSKSNSTWVECSIASCRAQYVVYEASSLTCRPKCHYCRIRNPAPDAIAPVVKCSKCLNRMIWPHEYRPKTLCESKFVCPPCSTGRPPTEDILFTARAASVQNTFSWLIKDTQGQNDKLFRNQSVSSIQSQMGGMYVPAAQWTLFPQFDGQLQWNGKPVLNTTELIAELKDMVAKRQTPTADCSLCSYTFKLSEYNRSCGRHGCSQRICNPCLYRWYGANKRGGIINPSALQCPFCRKFPTTRIMRRYNKAIITQYDTCKAIQDHESTVYAWCGKCSTVQKYMARDCLRHVPSEVKDWNCSDCVEIDNTMRLALDRQWANEAVSYAERVKDSILLAKAKKQRKMVDQAAEKWGRPGIKSCPGCQTPCERIDGCGVLICPVEECGANWCFFCGVKYDGGQIYEHMESVHGGVFGRFERDHD
ncbi:hypothetical protein N7456_000267 [Penicillium angulare]|uniref:RING-type domain-containing protein n=1 Tax=Penicillium angulare TaxID=116970 RepID=A0A9W9GBP7_9EURO|nr:hypothetical protein N7456_000267 [Penicillium angulare]